MKEHSFYQFALTVRYRKDSKGDLAEEIFNDLSFPKHEKISINCLTILKCKATYQYPCQSLMIYMKSI